MFEWVKTIFKKKETVKIETKEPERKIIPLDNNIVNNVKTEHVYESNVSKAFKEQKMEIELRAIKAHHCSDPTTCTKEDCWKFEPDKMTDYKKIEKRKTDAQRRAIQERREKRRQEEQKKIMENIKKADAKVEVSNNPTVFESVNKSGKIKVIKKVKKLQ